MTTPLRRPSLLWVLLLGPLSCASGPTTPEAAEPPRPAPEASTDSPRSGATDLALVVLAEPVAITPHALAGALGNWGLAGATQIQEQEGVITFELEGAIGAVGVMGAPIPWTDLEGPAEAAFMWPKAAEVLRPHGAHVIVSLLRAPGSSIERKLRLTRLVAAVVEATGALGVYWGDGPAVHEASTFVGMAREASAEAPPMPLWLGLSLARPDGGRLSLLTFGMEELGHKNLLVQGRDGNAALAFTFDIARYIVAEDARIAHGHTVGHSPTQRIAVEHRPSPVDPGETVIAIDLPDDFGSEP